MKFSKLWLLEFLNQDIDNVLLLNYITMSGLEVNNIESVSSYFNGVIIGNIVSFFRHPICDKFYILKIDINRDQLLNIVCNVNNNFNVNSRVAVAIKGALLPNNYFIKSIKIYNEISEGILCSFSDLKLYQDDEYSNNIIIFPSDAPIGEDVFNYLKLNDYSIDVKIAYNRGDCASLLGIARIISIYSNNIKLIYPNKKFFYSSINNFFIPVTIDVPEFCPKYLSRIITGIDFSVHTPIWMKEKLRRSNIKSINIINDVINCILLEFGCPITIFDYDKINKNIFVRYAKQGEEFYSVNNEKIVLFSDSVVIADDNKIISLAGIIDSSLTSVTTFTQNIVLESAYFCPFSIQNNTYKYCIHTDKSYRYERGVDYNLLELVMEKTTFLLISICGGKAGKIVNITNKLILNNFLKVITLKKKNIDRLIGYKISYQDICKIITRIGCEIYYSNTQTWKVILPSWRFDIITEEDLIDEITKIYGYNIIPSISIRHVITSTTSSCIDNKNISLSRLKILLVDRGYQEVITYSFVNCEQQQLLHPYVKPLALLNPISRNMSVMRLSLWTGLIDVLMYNQNRQQELIRVFESGFRFILDNKAYLGVRQDFMISGIIAGSRFDEHWDLENEFVDFYDIKGDIEAMFELTGNLNNVEFIVQYHPALHPGQSAGIYINNEFIGIMGAIHPDISTKLNLRNRHMLLFEFIWEKFYFYKIPIFKKISKFPSNRRDISIIIRDNIAVLDIINECKKNIKDQLVDIKIFDIYTKGDNIQKGFKSVSISLILQDYTHTLQEKEIAVIVKKCVDLLQKRFHAFIR